MSKANAIPTRNSAWLANLSAQVLPFLTFLVATPLVVAGLGGEDYGRLVIFSLFPQILTQFDLGIATSAVRLLSQSISKGGLSETKTALLRILGAGLIAGAVLAGVFYFTRDLTGSLVGIAVPADILKSSIDLEFACVALTALIGFANIPFSAYLRSVGHLRFVAINQSAAGILFWAASILITQNGGRVAHILAGGTVLAATSLLIQAAAALRHLNHEQRYSAPIPPHKKTPPWREFVDFAAFSAQLTSLVTYHADKMLISAFVSPAAAGAYSICANVAGKLLVFASAISAYSFPHAARLHAEDASPVLRQLQETGSITVVTATVFLAVPAFALSEAFLQLWLGTAFAHEYAAVLRLLLVGYALASFSTISSSIAYAIGRSDLCAKFSALGGILTLSSCFLLVRPYGAIGAASAALIGMSQAVLFSWVVSGIIEQPMARYWAFHRRIGFVGASVSLPMLVAERWVQSWGSIVTVGALGVVGCISLWMALRYLSPAQAETVGQLQKKIREFIRKEKIR